MLKKRIIPCLDVYQGCMVEQDRSFTGDVSPLVLAQSYIEDGADEIFFLDSSPHSDELHYRYALAEQAARSLSVPFVMAGAFKDLPCMQKMLGCGADRISLNSSVIHSPSLINRAVRLFGSTAVLVTVNVTRKDNGALVLCNTQHEIIEDIAPQSWIQDIQDRGAGEILVYSADRRSSSQGYDIALIEEFSSLLDIPLMIAGGCRGKEDMVEAFHAGASAVLAARIFHEGSLSIAECKEYGLSQGVDLRS